MTFLIIILTILLILNCLFLGLLILIQLPKKEAGVGVAFGGGATDALFGAGSGSALTKLTKYSAIAFFALVISLSFLRIRAPRASGEEFRKQFNKQSQEPVMPPPARAGATAPKTTNPAATTNPIPLNLVPLPTVTNAPPASNTAPVTNPPVAK